MESLDACSRSSIVIPIIAGSKAILKGIYGAVSWWEANIVAAILITAFNLILIVAVLNDREII